MNDKLVTITIMLVFIMLGINGFLRLHMFNPSHENRKCHLRRAIVSHNPSKLCPGPFEP